MRIGAIHLDVAKEQAGAAASPRLVRAAHEFEAMMMKELLQPMTAGNALTGADDGSDDGSGSGGALAEFASEALGRALSEQGGFGIADRIVHDLSHSGNKNLVGSVTGNPHGNTVLKSPQGLER